MGRSEATELPDLTEGLSAHPTMYEHDCLSNVICSDPMPYTRGQGHWFEPLLDRIQRDVEALTAEERERLAAWLNGRTMLDG